MFMFVVPAIGQLVKGESSMYIQCLRLLKLFKRQSPRSTIICLNLLFHYLRLKPNFKRTLTYAFIRCLKAEG